MIKKIALLLLSFSLSFIFASCTPKTEDLSTVQLAMKVFEELDAYRIKVDFEYQTIQDHHIMSGTTDYVLFREGPQRAVFISESNDDTVIWRLFDLNQKAYHVFSGITGYIKTPIHDVELLRWAYDGFLPDIKDMAETYLPDDHSYLIDIHIPALSFEERYPSFYHMISAFFVGYHQTKASPDYTDMSLHIKLYIDAKDARVDRIEIDYTDLLQETYELIEKSKGTYVPFYDYGYITYTFMYDDYQDLVIHPDILIEDDSSRYIGLEPIHTLTLGTWHETKLQYVLDMDVFRCEILVSGNYLFEASDGPFFNLIDASDPNRPMMFERDVVYTLNPGTYYIRAHAFNGYLGDVFVRLTHVI